MRCDPRKQSHFVVSSRISAELTTRRISLFVQCCLENKEGQHVSFLQQTVEQETNAHMQTMNAMAEMGRALQADVRQMKDKN